MALDRRYQAVVKNAGGTLVGVSQIRIGLPSVRALNTVTGVATVKAVQAVPDSTVTTVTGTDGSTQVELVVPGSGDSNILTHTLVSSGTYTGAYDGAFIIRYNGTTWDIYGPDGEKTTAASMSATPTTLKIHGAVCGATITGIVTTPVLGATFIVPVWAATAKNLVQTGIITPYSPFFADINSVGGCTDASWDPKLDTVVKLSSGFPEVITDTIIAKTSVGIKFTAQEWTNTNIDYLVAMIDASINKSQVSTISIEAVSRTRDGKLKTFWHPNCALDTLPTVAPKNDYSTFPWSFSALRQTEVSGETVVYNTWLVNSNIYNYLQYLH